jgi:hypothetical protein
MRRSKTKFGRWEKHNSDINMYRERSTHARKTWVLWAVAHNAEHLE